MGSAVLHFAGLRVDPPLLLAPMAGLTHSALRRLLLELGGVGLLTTEMLAAKRLPHDNPRLSPYLIRHESERPLAYQLLLIRREDAAPAVETLHRLGAEAIDLNLGCPAPEIRRLGGGSQLMEEPAAVGRLVREVRRRTGLPLSAKIRLGEELDARRLRDFCLMLEGEGVDLVTVHARLRGESFGRKPRWEWVAKVKSWLKIPVVANGGIFSGAEAVECLAATGADGLMIGRAAATHPWIFREIAVHFGCPAPPEFDRTALYLRFIALLEESFPPERRLGRLKEFTHYYARNYRFGHWLAAKVQASGTMEQASDRVAQFFRQNSR
ncbi:MAG TPA: tRNA-dihydrouridine synthase family protein [Desulfurivibrio alkaliphilus]|uniref:tRNA-dihydrouridine synthase n=1 Tax=Desulfurivibrio alkaliphilus TaxID=427923 RepID=A0A7C2Y0B0_9BACT|nr:tRNA-dihydrouridine synthase family protein [Desulfurivibrio alkaliphilus]